MDLQFSMATFGYRASIFVGCLWHLRTTVNPPLPSVAQQGCPYFYPLTGFESDGKPCLQVQAQMEMRSQVFQFHEAKPMHNFYVFFLCFYIQKHAKAYLGLM